MSKKEYIFILLFFISTLGNAQSWKYYIDSTDTIYKYRYHFSLDAYSDSGSCKIVEKPCPNCDFNLMIQVKDYYGYTINSAMAYLTGNEHIFKRIFSNDTLSSLQIDPGIYTIQIKGFEYLSFSQQIEIKKGIRTTIAVTAKETPNLGTCPLY